MGKKLIFNLIIFSKSVFGDFLLNAIPYGLDFGRKMIAITVAT